MTKLYLSVILLSAQLAYSQNPLVKQWDKRFGGTDNDILNSLQQASDGGFILGGYSRSGISGNKTQPSWGGSYDYWMVKTDSLGNMLWDKRFGGTDDDIFFALHQTTDGGFILGGYSESGVSGNKTEPSWGDTDYWIVKTDSLGNMLWDKRFGGTDEDRLFSLQQTIDGGFILGGYSESGVSGDKTQASWGDNDYWIVKIDAFGNYQWDKRFGGTSEDRLFSLQQTIDGGYILGGYSSSGVNGDKTQPSWGGYDYWMLKVDSLGTKLWDKRFGGTNNDYCISLQETADRGFILGGYSDSGMGGDKTEPSWGEFDYWIVKTDSLGNLQWNKRYGGTDTEHDFGNISHTQDEGYLIAGTSYSPISGDKTEANLGLEQTWVVKTDAAGLKLWDVTVFTTGHDEIGFTIQTEDGCYAMANYTKAQAGGYKTQGTWNNSYDYWIVKFCDSTCLAALPPASNLAADLTTVCEKSCVDFSDQSTDCPATWQWIFPGGSPGSYYGANPPDVCYNTPGTYDVTLITSNSFGSDTLLLPGFITVIPGPATPVITQANDTLTCSSALSYQWFLNGILLPGATDQILLITLSGDYTVTIADSNGCSASDTIDIVLPTVAAFSSSDTIVCITDCIQFTDQSLNAVNYQWFFPGGNPTSSTNPNPIICYDTTGIYDVTLLAGNSIGTDTLILSGYVTVSGLPSPPVIIQTGNALTCSPASTYQWFIFGLIIPGATTQTISISLTGNYSVEIEFNGCISSAAYNVTSIQAPGINSSDTLLCEKFCVDFFDQTSGNSLTWFWQFPGGTPSSSTDKNPAGICYDNPGIFDVMLITTTIFGADTLLVPEYITVYPTPPFPVITQSGYTLSSSPATSYQWQFNSVDIPGVTNQSYTVTQTGFYAVIVSDSNGCVNSTTLYVEITGVEDLFSDQSISIYPNPSNGYFIVEFSSAKASANTWLNCPIAGSVSLEIRNTIGQLVFASEENLSSGTSKEFKKEIDLSKVANGVYFIELSHSTSSGIAASQQAIRKLMIVK